MQKKTQCMRKQRNPQKPLQENLNITCMIRLPQKASKRRIVLIFLLQTMDWLIESKIGSRTEHMHMVCMS